MKQINILVVDDNELNRNLLTMLLDQYRTQNSLSFNIFTCINGQEAVDICEKKSVDLIFMDYLMPVMDGSEATGIIKRKHPHIMIIAVSSYEDEAKQKEMLHNGAEDYVVKPLTEVLFNSRLNNYLQLLQNRNHISHSSSAVNLFTKKIYNYRMEFSITSEEDLAQFWEAVLIRFDFQRQIEHISDFTRFIYYAGSIRLQEEGPFRIIVEEETENFFFTLEYNENPLHCEAMETLINSHCQHAVYRCIDGVLSFILKKKSLQSETAPSGSVEQTETIVSDTEPSTAAEKNIRHLSEEEKGILHKSQKDIAISAKEYSQDVDSFVLTELQELDDLEKEVSDLIEELQDENHAAMPEIISRLHKYAAVLNSLIEFQPLAFSLESLSNLLSEVDLSKIEPSVYRKMIIYLSNIIMDFSSWRKIIFIDQDANDIHYMDSSLFSSILQLEQLFKADQTYEEDENELELF